MARRLLLSSGIAALTVLSFPLVASASNAHTGPLNFEAGFYDHVVPFTIKVDRQFIKETTHKVSKLRVPTDIIQNEPDYTEGVPSSILREWASYWVDQYDWDRVEDSLNEDLQHFTTTVQAKANYTHPIPLHFVHHQSDREDAIPLLFIHGWPGTSHEVAPIIDLLTNPPNASLPAFHVVAPDLPGFGFSPAPEYAGLGPREMGQAFDDLMLQLGYSRYVGQGGDFGSHILRLMSVDAPDSLVSILSNMLSVAPSPDDMQRFAANLTTPEETALIGMLTDPAFSWTKTFWDIESQLPLQAALGLTDSPIAWMAWPYKGMRMLVPGYEWSIHELITWSLLNFIQGPYGTFRLYKEAKREGVLDGVFPYVKQPTGVLKYFGDAGYLVPLSWAQRQANVTFMSTKAEDVLGGHFPSIANPQSLVEDCWAFFGDEQISGTGVFRQ